MNKATARTSAILLATTLFAATLVACDGDTVESKFSNNRASFSFSPVNTIAPLTQAMGSYGEYCTISADALHYYFHTLNNSAQINRDAYAAYKTFICIGGFIVGRSSLTELGTGDYPYLCYDLACPNCNYNDNIAKALTLENGALASCSRCHRTYDLSNGGLVVSGEKGRKLERYRISYTSTAIIIAN